MSHIYWFTGQPGHGKTTLALALKRYLENKSNKEVFHVDGDDLRAVTNNKNYSEQGRRENILTAQKIAHFLSLKGAHVVVSLVSPYRDMRESFKKQANVHEIYVTTSQMRGREGFQVLEYEAPLENYKLIDTSDVSVEKSLEEIINHFNI